MKKTITHQEYLQLQGLFYLAQTHYAKSSEFEKAIGIIVEAEDIWSCGHISDAIVDGGITFDEAMKKEGISVEEAL